MHHSAAVPARHNALAMLLLDFMAVKPTIVIVEDDKAVRESLRMVLETYGYAVEDFATGEAFLDQKEIGGERFVVIDNGLPGVSGIEALRQMRRRNVALPAVIVSGGATANLVTQARRVGALALLDKPIDIDALLRAIEKGTGARWVQPSA